jgi:hypothetical protein
MIRLRSIAACLLVAALAACGGGGMTAPGAATAPLSPTLTSGATQAAATVSLSISFPKRSTSGHGRRPQYVSPGTESFAFYDGSELVYAGNIDLAAQQQFSTVYASSGPTTLTPGSCTDNSTTDVCTATITTQPGRHVFDMIAYPTTQGASASPSPQPSSQPSSNRRRTMDIGTPPTFTGVILSEGELVDSLSPGPNPGATLTMLGVASDAEISAPEETEIAYNGSASFPFQVLDSAGYQILTPGTYDNGPVTLTASNPGIVTITPSSFASPPSSPGDQSFSVACTNPNGGSVTVSMNAKTAPNTTYASNLAYSPSNYSPGTIATTVVSCDAQASTQPITVQSHRRSNR